LGENAKNIANLVLGKKRNNQLRTGYFFYSFYGSLLNLIKKGSANLQSLYFLGSVYFEKTKMLKI